MTSDVVDQSKRTRKSGRELSPKQAAAAVMIADAKARGLALTGPDGLLKVFTKNVLETALGEEMTEHLGYEKNRADSDRGSRNIRNGSRPKTVVSDAVGDVEIQVQTSDLEWRHIRSSESRIRSENSSLKRRPGTARKKTSPQKESSRSSKLY